MMNDEQSSPDRLTQGSGAPDLDGVPDRNGSAAGYHGAFADRPADGRGASARPGFGEPATGSAGMPVQGGEPVEGDEPGEGGEPGDGGEPVQGDPGGSTATVRKSRGRSTWRELPILIVVALTIALVIKTFVVQPFFIPSSSMEDTLLVGDKVLVNKLVYHFRSIQRGDIIVFNGVGSWNAASPPAKSSSDPLVRAYDATLRPLFHSIAGLFGTPVGQTDYIKRVIGVPGDDVACCNAQDLVTVNGVPLHESSYLFPGATPSQIRFNKVVPAGRLWVMGDNRAVSDDSRLRQTDPGGGTIPENEVIGRAFVIVWPPSRWRFLPIPATFSQPGITKQLSASESQQLSAQQAAAARLLGAQVRPEAPYVPLAAGFGLALPLTWLQRQARRRARRPVARKLPTGRGPRLR